LIFFFFVLVNVNKNLNKYLLVISICYYGWLHPKSGKIISASLLNPSALCSCLEVPLMDSKLPALAMAISVLFL
jgi:hypothetical protein